MNVWTDVIQELVENNTEYLPPPGSEPHWQKTGTNHHDGKNSNLVYDITPETADMTSAESKRRKELTASDPVHTIHIVEWVRHYLLQAQNKYGPEGFKAKCIDNVDKDVLADFMKLKIF